MSEAPQGGSDQHKVPCGTFTCYETAAFLKRLFCEDVDGYNILCKECHLKETANQKKGK
jgi:hypothetical protein